MTKHSNICMSVRTNISSANYDYTLNGKQRSVKRTLLNNTNREN